MICEACNVQLTLSRRSRNFFPRGGATFCSEHCLRSFATRQRALKKHELADLGIQRPPKNESGLECYSPYLGVSFRSWFECSVAEHVVRYWQTQIFYEPHCIPVDARHSYVPDFWLPEFGVWLEVKGEWRLGAKQKFEKATALLGSNRLLLLPDFYKTWFRRRRGQ